MERLLVLKLDVSKPQELISAFAQVKKTFSRLDVVFNKAGYAVLTNVEGYESDVAIRAMFNLNFWVSKNTVKIFHEINKPGVGGRLVQLSSHGSAEGIATVDSSSTLINRNDTTTKKSIALLAPLRNLLFLASGYVARSAILYFSKMLQN